MPRFSIVMPTFRREHTIHRTIDTIRAQTFTDWELIVVDNAGSDYRFEDPRIRCFVYLERGSSRARNYGIGKVSGELTCFFDDDDIMFPNYLETFHRIFDDAGVMMARCGMLTGRDGTIEDFSHATPEVVVRTPFVTPHWESSDCHDQKYFQRVIAENGWREGQIVRVPEILVRATSDGSGGLRHPEGLF